MKKRNLRSNLLPILVMTVLFSGAGTWQADAAETLKSKSIAGNHGAFAVRSAVAVRSAAAVTPTFTTKYVNNQKVNKNFEINGKITGVKAAQTVKVYMDKVEIGSFDTDEKGEFTYLVPITDFKFAFHTIRMDAKLSNGKTISLSRTVNYTPFMIYDITGIKEKAIYTEKIAISGWALNYKGIKGITVYVDNMKKPVGKLNTGLASEAVAAEYGNYKGSDTAGFLFEMPVDMKKYKAGAHKIKVDILGNDNTLKTKTFNVTFAERKPYYVIEGIKNNLVSENKDIALKGWFIAPDGEEKVRVYLDEVEQTSIQLGLERKDIGEKYIDYGNSMNSGYELVLPVNKIKRGAHKLRVEYTSKGTIVQTGNFDFSVKKADPVLTMDKPIFSNTVAGRNMTITGYGLHPSGVTEIRLFVDDVLQPNVIKGLPNSAAEKKYPNYPDSKAPGFTAVVDVSSWSLSQHTVKVMLVGTDGEEFLYDKPMSLDGVTYGFMKNKLSFYSDKEYKRGRNVIGRNGWVKATQAEITTYLDPLSYMNDATYKYVFMKLNYFDGITAEMLNKALVGKGVLEGKGQVFLDAGKTYDVNPIYLVSHSLIETGNGKSTLAKGINTILVKITQKNELGEYMTFPVTTPKVVYNVFGTGAYDDDPLGFGSSMAFTGGIALKSYDAAEIPKVLNGDYAWDTIDKAIMGGAKFIANGYVSDDRYSTPVVVHKDGTLFKGDITYKQNTLYKMKWDLFSMENEKFSPHQYATDVQWARSQTKYIKALVDLMGSPQLQYEVPIFVQE